MLPAGGTTTAEPPPLTVPPAAGHERKEESHGLSLRWRPAMRPLPITRCSSGRDSPAAAGDADLARVISFGWPVVREIA
jgi:hypothetical protein